MLCHWDEAHEEPIETGHLRASWTDLGRAAGSVHVGLRRQRIAPGAQSTPAHVHDAEEELCFVLAGDGLSWQDGSTYAIRAGDALLHAPGGAAHTLIAGDDGLTALMFGERRRVELARLPRAGVGWLGESWADVGDGASPWVREVAAGPVPREAPAARPPRIVALEDVEAVQWGRGDCASLRRDLGRAMGSASTGLCHLTVPAGRLSAPPHCHSAEEELFVVLDGDGALLLGDEEHAVRAGHVVSRPAGTGVPHAFRAGDGGLTLLAYGERRSDDMTWYPRSAKLRARGLGVTFRVTAVDYWEGEA